MHATTATGGVTNSRLTARERAELRDKIRRAELGLGFPESAEESDAPAALHGDVDINGDLVDELAPSRRLALPFAAPIEPDDDRTARLARAITGVNAAMARDHLACVLSALERIPAR